MTECFRNLLYLPFFFQQQYGIKYHEKEAPIIINIKLFYDLKEKKGKEKRED